MDGKTTDDSPPKKFQVKIGEKIAYVEIISVEEQICAVEFPGHGPIFITRINDRNNKPCWISIPQGNDELAASIGSFLEVKLHQ
ncbi:MAG TPA: hypothetical protein VFP87_03945 [Chitinophagaceae bacterium]|nr:hypothetical protein [Chitinophagaceae bacterium]